ncbi:hypothetical protein XENOCAPTIV_027549 [Xenoophorus captivus]|uniref:HMG box domain-containing protein n=1 Tax=Xenoophorus captivus TaxID=1517983 RepID=A0ABV0S6F4_9TELE
MIIVWVQDDLLKLLEAMKVALPQKDLTKYKTSESHLDWQKVAFNSYTAEMCKQKWQEISKEVSHFKLHLFQAQCLEETLFRANPCMFDAKKIRKFRTLTELIVDAQDYIKNPYKGKKLKYDEIQVRIINAVFCYSLLLPCDRLIQTSLVNVFRNGYSMFCAELMSSMKDVPSTERMVMCSQRWKLLKQNEKDAYQKRCEQASTEKPKRPISAMFIFAEEKRPKLQQERPDLPDSELTRLLARMWNELPDKKKVMSLLCKIMQGNEMLSNGELNHLPMKERMAEIGSRWQRLPLKDKDRYKKIAEEKQRQYKVLLEQWLAVRSCCFKLYI